MTRHQYGISALASQTLACVASVSVWFRSKEDRGRGFSVLTAREMKLELKNERGGGGGEGRKRFLLLIPTPSPLFYLRHFSRGL